MKHGRRDHWHLRRPAYSMRELDERREHLARQGKIGLNWGWAEREGGTWWFVLEPWMRDEIVAKTWLGRWRVPSRVPLRPLRCIPHPPIGPTLGGFIATPEQAALFGVRAGYYCEPEQAAPLERWRLGL